MSQLIAHPGMLTSSAAFDVIWLVDLAIGVVFGRLGAKEARSTRLSLLIGASLALIGTVLQVRELRRPPPEHWIMPLVGLCSTGFLLTSAVTLLAWPNRRGIGSR